MPFGYVPFFNFPGAHILAKNSISILNGSKFQFLKFVFIISFRTVNILFISLELFFESESDFDFISHNVFLHKWDSSRNVFGILKNLFDKSRPIILWKENIDSEIKPRIDSYLSHFQ